ncbi:MAG TPA: AAA family ATPase [Clostridiales bacterium]|nr:AAA family ATPase [Clostridiales bacterium]
MSHVIAVAGKGGVGKTTLCGLLIQYLTEHGKSPVLAVDADSNSNLNEVLGVETQQTLGEIREKMKKAASLKSEVPSNMSKDVYAEKEVFAALTEEDDFDLLVMGRSQGQGCYCFVNGLLQRQIMSIQENYPYIVVDNEAGMEHISRGLLPHIDTVILVSDCSRRGIQAAARIAELTEEMEVRPGKMGLVVNRAPKGILNEGTKAEIANSKLELFGVIPDDELVYEYDSEGKAIVKLPEDSPVKVAFQKIMAKLAL